MAGVAPSIDNFPRPVNQAVNTAAETQVLNEMIPNVRPFYLITKRLMDITVSVITLILLSPAMLLTAAAIKIEDPEGKVFYNAPRGGKDSVCLYA